MQGCSTCRTRKLKCDEKRPLCSRCAQSQLRCEWNQPAQPRRLPIRQIKDAGRPTRRGAALLRPAGLGPKSPSQVVESQSARDSESIKDYDIETPRLFPVNHNFAYENSAAGLLRPALSTDHIPLSNSLKLDSRDVEAFHYVPQSLMVLRFGKPWPWSMLSYVHSKLACREIGVMRAFIAVASMELRFQELIKFEDASASPVSSAKARWLKASATNHLYLAFKDLSFVLDCISQGTRNAEDVDALFSMWFLILNFGLYDSELVSACQVHLDGIRSFISQYLNGTDHDQLPPATQQLMVFIAYVNEIS